MRFHLLGIPHTVTSKEYVACAYTQKVWKLGHMLRFLGHEVIHYGVEGADLDCNEAVTVSTRSDLEQAYPGYDFRKSVFRFDTSDHAYQTFYRNSIEEIGKRKQKHDFLLCMWGSGHWPVANAHPDLITVEPGIGYAGGHFAAWKVFESYALLHAYLGLGAVSDAGKCENYSVVIPNYFDDRDFTYSERSDDYFLCLGRVNCGKGVHIAIQLAEKLGVPLKIAGQGSLADVGYGEGMKPIPPNVEHVGFADVEKRRKLLSRAKGLLLLSQYVEPFGGVAVEAMMSGTPVISSDWGVFNETILHGETGYRVRTFGQGLWAMRNIGKIRRQDCRYWARTNFSMNRVANMYEEFFRSVLNVYTGEGWYEPEDDRRGLGWLRRFHPDTLSLEAVA
jgi:glycosyltransferase involved in cell wall biosynthesis